MAVIKTVDAKQVKNWLDNQEAIIIDVREESEYATCRIPDAKLIPLAKIEPEKLPPACKEKKIVIHCQLGKRGRMACEKLLADNPDLDIYNLEGGITAWRQEGYKTFSNDEKKYKVEQQNQITIGAGVLLGLLLGFFVHPVFLLLSAFIAGGLLYDGLTGSTYLNLLIAKLPWNK